MARRGMTGWRWAAAGLLGLLAAGCATDRLTLADYRMEPYRPAIERAPIAVDLAAAPEPSRPAPVAPTPESPVSGTPSPAVAEVTAAPAPDGTGDGTDGRTGARVLRPGSRVEIRLRGIPEPESFADQVDSRGEITLPHLGVVHVAGMATSQAERHIERTYIERDIFKSINIIITTEEEEYFVQGEVGRPGKYMVTRDLTLMQAISEAGGFTPFADRRRIRVMRETGAFTVHNARDIADGSTDDPPIQPKDIIDVPKSLW